MTRWVSVELGLSVNLPMMTDADDQNGQFLVEGFVDDPIASHAKPAQPAELPLECSPRGGVISESVDGFDQEPSISRTDATEGLCGAALDLDRVAHA
jgi:hypothetical protein